MKKILYLSYDGMTDPLGQSQVLPYLAGLSNSGYSITLISFEKKNKYAENKNQIEQICSQAHIQWTPLSYTKRPPVFSTLWDYRKMIRKARQLHDEQHFDLVHCRSYITSLAGLVLKKKNGLKFLFDMRGFWADERVDGKLWNLRNPLYHLIYKFFKSKENEFLQQADGVISLTESGKSEMLNWQLPNLSAPKIKVIPCAADFSLFSLVSSEKRELAKIKLGFSKGDFVLSYVGSLGTWYLLEEMAKFFQILKTKCSTAKFLILTPDDPEFAKGILAKQSVNLADVVIMYAPRKQLVELVSASDYNLFFIKQAYSKKASSPTKLGEMLAMGIPVICNSGVGDVESIVNKTNSGICVHDFSTDTLSKAVDQILKHDPYDHAGIRRSAYEIYDLQRGIESYCEVYDHLLKTNEELPVSS